MTYAVVFVIGAICGAVAIMAAVCCRMCDDFAHRVEEWSEKE